MSDNPHRDSDPRVAALFAMFAFVVLGAVLVVSWWTR